MPRNDLNGATALFKRSAERGPVPPELMRSLAMLQDEPRDFYAALVGVDCELEAVGERYEQPS